MKTLKAVITSILLIGPSIAFAQPVIQGSFNNVTYIAVLAANGITWTAAEANAVAMGGQLASITSAAENQFVYSLASSDVSLWAPLSEGGIGPWLGGYNQAGSFQWTDGTPFSYSNWASGEPNNFGGDENYIQYYSPGPSLMANTWNDAPNDTTGDPYHVGVPNPHGYIVEIVPEASATNLFLLGAALSIICRFRRGQPVPPLDSHE
jgi:hypothetical protein